ncbi:MAG: acyl-CoA thioesterase [Gammaproteobacteria bacterium]|nr:acyl-CoA thioesterase [Gammaproteobacteria bacterium]
MAETGERSEPRMPTTRMLAMPTDTNASGDIFGGWIMSQVDIAGAIAAYDHARGRVVTVAVNSFQFHAPVYVGDIVTCYADVVRVGNTSLTVEVEVFAERGRDPEQRVRVTEATLTYVAVDETGKPRIVPKQADS